MHKVPVLGSGGSNVFRNHVDGAVRGKHSALLPGQEVAAEVSCKIDSAIRFQKSLIRSFVILTVASGNPCALAEECFLPGDVHWILQLLAMTRMQPLNRSPRSNEFGFH